MESTLIGKALKYAKALFENDSSGHDYFHTLRVCKTALTLAEAEHADPLVTGLAAALHDADDRKLSPETTKTKANARAFAYGGAHGRPMHDPGTAPEENMDAARYYAHEATTVNHFYEKLLKLKAMMNTDAARRMAEERDRYMRAFLEEFYAEWEGER